MSDLQLWLLAIGAGVVVAVLVFNWLQERRFRKQADAAFQKPMGDALMQPEVGKREPSERIEPALQTPAFDAGGLDDVPSDIEPHFSTGASVSQGVVSSADEVLQPVTTTSAGIPPRTSNEQPAPPDELLEYRIRISRRDGVPANTFADAYNRARTLGKAVRWTGLPVGAAVWEDIQPWRDVQYQDVAVMMQLADRVGAVEESQLLALRDGLQAMANTHGLSIACDDIADALERARAIDHFCVDVDILIGLNVVASGDDTLSFAHIVREAEGGGMVLGADGAFQLLDSRGEPLYSLCNHDAEPFAPEAPEGQTSQGVTLQFDVPRVPDGLKVFDSMVAFGRKLAQDVGGVLVDDNQRPLTDAGIEKIRTQLVQIYSRMEARGVPSGSRRALRLFS
jgi:FtsZ-interacting cell division protein ZipA